MAEVEDGAMPSLASIAAELYGARLEEFTAARDGRAKELRASGERELAREVAAFRRPTTAAWAVNRLVRAHPGEVEQLLALGAALRDAQEAFAGEELRELNRQQHRVIAAIRQRARAVAAQAGQRLTESVGRQVEATLKAGMADPAAADAIRSGLLTTDLESTGFDPVDLEGAVAVAVAGAGAGSVATRRVAAGTGAGAARRPARSGARSARTPDQRADVERDRPAAEEADRPAAEEADRRAAEEAERQRAEERRREERAREVAEARALAARATQALEGAEGALTSADATLAEVGARRAQAAARVAELRMALEAAEADDTAAAGELEAAGAARERAAQDAEDARRSVERAAVALEHLERKG